LGFSIKYFNRLSIGDSVEDLLDEGLLEEGLLEVLLEGLLEEGLLDEVLLDEGLLEEGVLDDLFKEELLDKYFPPSFIRLDIQFCVHYLNNIKINFF
jgi:hypothetical protein